MSSSFETMLGMFVKWKSLKTCKKGRKADTYSEIVTSHRRLLLVCVQIVQWPASRGSQRCLWWLTSTSPWRVVKAWSTGPGTQKIRSSSQRVSLSPGQQVREWSGLAEPSFSHNAPVFGDSSCTSLALHARDRIRRKKSRVDLPGILPKCLVLWSPVFYKDYESLNRTCPSASPCSVLCRLGVFSMLSDPRHSPAYCTSRAGAKPFG